MFTYWDEHWLRLRDMSLGGYFAGHEVILCGTGPSLKKVNPTLVEGSGKIICALNNAFTVVSPHLWIGMDSPDSFDLGLWERQCHKFYNIDHIDAEIKGVKAHLYSQTYFLRTQRNAVPLTDGREAPHGFQFEGTTFSTAIHLLHYLGFVKIYLVGCDFGGSNALSQIGDRYKKEKYNTKAQAKALSNALGLLEYLAEERGDIEIISCTPKSKANKFLEYIPIEEIV